MQFINATSVVWGFFTWENTQWIIDYNYLLQSNYTELQFGLPSTYSFDHLICNGMFYFCRKILQHVKEYCDQAAIHGPQHFVSERLAIFERLVRFHCFVFWCRFRGNNYKSNCWICYFQLMTDKYFITDLYGSSYSLGL